MEKYTEDNIYHPTNETTLCYDIEKRPEKKDKGLHKTKRRLIDDLGRSYTKKIYYYQSFDNARIRNGKTGCYYDYKFGSDNEKMLFSAILTNDSNGKTHYNTVFYDTPEEFEEHQRIKVKDDVKYNWNLRQLNFI
jgi:hypothetical protein